MTSAERLAGIVKAYDVRGLVPEQLDEELAAALGAAFAHVVGGSAAVVAHDMRASSPDLAAAFARGVTGQGLDVLHAGLGSTDLLYYASGSLDLPGAMITASHNPARYNGIKLCRAGAVPIGADSGLAEIRARAATPLPPAAAGPGRVRRRDLLAGYAGHLRGLVDLTRGRPLTVVVDAGNGMAGHTVPAVLGPGLLGPLPVTVVPLYFELDGSFPNHEANPLEPANLRDLQAAVPASGANLGLAFDGDADRCFVVDEQGRAVSPSTITALVAARELDRTGPGGTVLYNLICSRAVPEVIAEHGGTPVRTRVGHSYIKAEMARTGAVFGGEHSAHYYFRDFWRADTGLLAALHVLAALGASDRPLSELVAGYQRYSASGEINSTVPDPGAVLAAVRARYAAAGAGLDDLDGLTVDLGAGRWFNLRASNTEPLLRLNVEAPDGATMAVLRDEVLALVRADRSPAAKADEGGPG